MENNLLDNLYDAYDFLYIHDGYVDLINKFERDTEKCKEKYLRIKKEKVSVAPLYLAVFFASVMLLMLGGLIASQMKSGVLVFIILTIIICAFIILNKHSKNMKKEPERRAAEFWSKTGSPICVSNEKKIKKLNNELNKFRHENQQVLDILPVDYRNDITIVAYIIHVIENNLADTLKEALHLYIEQKHRWEVEATMHGMAKNMEIHNREMESYMSEISAQQRITNSRLADIEMLTFLDYINK